MKRMRRRLAPFSALFSLLLALPLWASAGDLIEVPIPGGKDGVGFDELRFAPGLRKILAPGGGTGKLFLVDLETRKVTGISGFGIGAYKGGHGQGVTSADEGRGLVFLVDRTSMTLAALDPATWRIADAVPVSSAPDAVRYVAATGEVWVTEPAAGRIEVFSLSQSTRLEHAAFIPVPGGPQALELDPLRGLAYTHLQKEETLALDVSSRAEAGRWRNGCAASRGLALDAERGLLFSGCSEGKVTAVSLRERGKLLSSLDVGPGVDAIAYSPKRRRLYVPAGKSELLAVVSAADDGTLTQLDEVYAPRGAHCAAADDRGGVWICDPAGGRLGFLLD